MSKFLGANLRKKRLEHGYTQVELAQKVNTYFDTYIVDRTTISRWEISKGGIPRQNKLAKVAKVLGCQVEEFFAGYKKEESKQDFSKSTSKILSLNTNNFCGPYNWNEIQGREKFQIMSSYMNRIGQYIKRFLNSNKKGVVILQEVPFRDKWFKRNFFKMFEGYSILQPTLMKNNERMEIVTLAIANEGAGWKQFEERKSLFKEFPKHTNRIVEIANRDTQIFGVHLSISKDDGAAWKRLWDLLIRKVKNEKNTVIVGDFNAHRNEHRSSEHRYKLEELDIYCHDLIDDSIITFYPAMTTIDHVYYSKDQDVTNLKVEVVPKNYSDHAIIIADILLDV